MPSASALVLPALLLLSMSGIAQDAGSIRGRVLSEEAEVPLGRVALYLVLDGLSSHQPMMTNSQEDGTFEFAPIQPGRYLVLQEAEWETYAKYGKNSNIGLRQRAYDVVPGQRLPDILIRAQVGNILEGRVTDRNNIPVGGVQVNILRSLARVGLGGWLPVTSTTTWPDGTYQITGIREKVLVEAQTEHRSDGLEEADHSKQSSSSGLVQTFYPSVLDAKSATPIDLEGDRALVRNVDIQMQRGPLYSIRGAVANANDGRRYKIYIERDTDLSTLRMLRVPSDNSFDIGDLPSGKYGLELLDDTPGVRMRLGPAVIAYTKVELKDESVESVSLAIKAAPVVTARLTVTGASDTGNISLFLRPTSNPTARMVFSRRSQDGIYTFLSVSPEPNQLTALSLPPGTVIQKVSFNG